MIAQELEVSLHMAFVEARQKRHEFITVEHLLLAPAGNAERRERGADAADEHTFRNGSGDHEAGDEGKGGQRRTGSFAQPYGKATTRTLLRSKRLITFLAASFTDGVNARNSRVHSLRTTRADKLAYFVSSNTA